MVTATATPRKTTFNSLRDFLAVLEKRNLVHHIPVPVEKDWEVGAICRDVVTIPGGKSIWLDVSRVPSRRGESDLMGIDATKPIREYAREGETFPPTADPTPEQMEKVRQRWKEYGFRE